MNLQQNPDGTWSKAEPLPYDASFYERLTHFFGKHWYYSNKSCLLCGKDREIL